MKSLHVKLETTLDRFLNKETILQSFICDHLTWRYFNKHIHVDWHNLHVLPRKMQYWFLMHTCGMAQSSCSLEINAISSSDSYMWIGTFKFLILYRSVFLFCPQVEY